MFDISFSCIKVIKPFVTVLFSHYLYYTMDVFNGTKKRKKVDCMLF